MLRVRAHTCVWAYREELGIGVPFGRVWVMSDGKRQLFGGGAKTMSGGLIAGYLVVTAP